MQADDHNSFPNITEPAMFPAAAQFQDAHGVNISGNSQFTNIGVNHNVNFYGKTHGLENLKEFVSFAALHNSFEQDPDRCCHSGTRENILSRLRYWIDNPSSSDRRIFWLYGPAGAGKSAIAQTIAHGYKQGEVAATFFFYRSDPGRNDGNRLFTTIAWQLAFSIPAIKDSIVHALNKTPHLPKTNVETQFEHLVAHPTNNIACQMPQLAPVVIIDGVDECTKEQLQRRLLSVIGNAVKDPRCRLRFLVCSRPEALIEETLNQFKDFTLHIDLATLDDSKHDIEKYLSDTFSDIVSKRGLDPAWPGQAIIHEIVFKSSGNFILASTLMRFIGDEDHNPESQLDIVRKLKPHGTMSPFALLDELYLEILNRQLDQDFLKTFLALLVGRSTIEVSDLHQDDTVLMDVSKKDLHIKLRRMRSLLQFEPFIDVYHKSFLDFLQESTRSDQYHVSKQDGQKRYLELIVDSVARHVSVAIEHPNYHKTCSFSPRFKFVVRQYPLNIDLPAEDWQEALKPLVDLQHKLLKISGPRPCRITQLMRDLLLHLIILQRISQPIAPAQVPQSNIKETVAKWSRALATKAKKINSKKSMDSCLSTLLSLQKSNTVMAVDTTIIDCMSSLLALDCSEITRRVQSVFDAQKLIDVVDLLINNRSFLRRCGPDAARKAALLVSEIFARVPLLPESLFLNKPFNDSWATTGILEVVCQQALLSRILDHNCILPVLKISIDERNLCFSHDNMSEQYKTVDAWLRASSPDFVTRIRVMLEVARTIRYIHSMDIVLDSGSIKLTLFYLDSNLRAKVRFIGSFAWFSKEALTYQHEDIRLSSSTYKSNISAFGDLFDSAYFDGNNKSISPNNSVNGPVEDARRLIERCHARDPKSQLTMEDVVNEIEPWNLT